MIHSSFQKYEMREYVRCNKIGVYCLTPIWIAIMFSVCWKSTIISDLKCTPLMDVFCCSCCTSLHSQNQVWIILHFCIMFWELLLMFELIVLRSSQKCYNFYLLWFSLYSYWINHSMCSVWVNIFDILQELEILYICFILKYLSLIGIKAYENILQTSMLYEIQL